MNKFMVAENELAGFLSDKNVIWIEVPEDLQKVVTMATAILYGMKTRKLPPIVEIPVVDAANFSPLRLKVLLWEYCKNWDGNDHYDGARRAAIDYEVNHRVS